MTAALRGAANLLTTEGAAHTAPSLLRSASTNGEREIVADTPHKYGLDRTYQAYTERSEDTLMIFRNTAAAARWLGIDVHPRATFASAV